MTNFKEVTEVNLPTHEEMLSHIENYLKRNGIKSYEFGKKYLNDSGALSRLKSGSDPRLSTVIRLYQIIKDED